MPLMLTSMTLTQVLDYMLEIQAELKWLARPAGSNDPGSCT